MPARGSSKLTARFFYREATFEMQDLPPAVTHATAVDPAAEYRRPRGRNLRERLPPAVGFMACALLWELARILGVLPGSATASVPEILRVLFSGLMNGELVDPLLASIQATAGGFLWAVVIGLPLGLLIGVSRWVDAVTRQVVEFLRPIPSVSLIPVGIVVFGLGMGMQYFLVTFACVWPVVINARYGARNVDPLLLDAARSMGCSRRELLQRVVLPSSLPAVVTGLRLSAIIAVIVAVATQMVSGSPGLGRYIVRAQNDGAVPETYAGVLLISLFGWLISVVGICLERRFVTARTNTVGEMS